MNKYQIPIRRLADKYQILFVLLMLVMPLQTSASTLFAGSAQQTVYERQSFVVDWFLDTRGESINALKIDLSFSPDTLEATDLSTSNSLISLWVSPPRITGIGKISLEGGMPGGVSGGNVPIFRSTFKAIKTGQAKITMDASSQVLLNDGKGTEDRLTFTALAFPLLPAGTQPIAIASATHPDQNQWYKTGDVRIKFSPKAGESYSYSFSSNLDIVPESLGLEVPEEIEYKNLPDGIYYFKLNSKIGNANWQDIGIYRMQIDATPPENFLPIISQDKNLFGNQPFVSFSTVDKTSGLEGYKIKTGLFGKFHKAVTPYVLRKPLIGDKIKIQAQDKAGNMRTVVAGYPGYLSNKQFGAVCILIFIILGLLINKKLKKQK